MSLEDLFAGHEDRVINKWLHYLPIYERHFSSFVGKPITFIEIGIAHGGSLQIWKRYLGSQARIIGLDVNPECKLVEEDQIAVRIGPQQDCDFLQSIIDEFGAPDVVLDDGSHVMSDICDTFRFLYPQLAKDGLYMVEDLHTAYWDEYGGGLRREGSFMELCKDLVDELNAYHARDAAPPTDFTRTTLGIHFYDSIVAFQRGDHPQGAMRQAGRKYLPARLIDTAQRAIELQRPHDAIAVLAPALSDPAADPRLHHVMGVAKGLIGDTEGAISHFTEAIARDPDLNQAIYALGLVYSNLRRFKEAIHHFERSVALDPSFEQNRYLLAATYLQAGAPGKALLLLDELTSEQPENKRFAEVVAYAVQKLGGTAKAAEILLSADRPEGAGRLLSVGAVTEESFGVLWKIAAALMEKQRYRLAQRMFQRMIELDPTAWSAGWNAHFCRLQLGTIDGALAWLGRFDRPENPERARILDAMLYVAPLTTDMTMPRLHDLAVYAQKLLASGAVPLLHSAPEAGKRPLTIGFLSRIFHLPNYAQIYLGLFRNLDRSRFRVIAICNGPVPTEGSVVRSCVDGLIELGDCDAQGAAQAIQQGGVDILIDCNGFGAAEGNRILDLKPAPIQVGWSNKHYTTGMSTTDWMIADASIDGIDPSNFVERIYRLPCFHIDMPALEGQTPAPAPLRRNGHVTIGAQIAGLKLNRAMLVAWARILRAAAGTRLLLRFGGFEDTHALIREIMAAEGVDEERLDLRFGAAHSTYLETFAEIDLVLDRFPISGGVTSLEALWQGVPIVSWMGESWASRRGGALLRQLGLAELVAESLDAYVELAVGLCRDPERLVHYRETLPERVGRAGLADDRMLADAMAEGFDRFWRDYVAGE